MLYNLTHAVAVNVQIELSGIHGLRKVYSAEPQGVRKLDFYSETKVFLSSVCVVYCKAASRFHTKTRIRFVLIRTYRKVTTFL